MPRGGMFWILDAQYSRRWPPGITGVRTRSKKLIVVPIPILRHRRRCQRETGEMKTHPGAAPFHVLPEGLALKPILRPSIEKQHHLILGKNPVVELGPIGS